MTDALAPAPTVLQDLALDQLEPHPRNVRGHLGDLTELAASISEQGILEPLLVLPPTLEGKHVVVAGHRRLAAALKAKKRPVSVPCVIRSLTEAQVVEQMLVENMQRAEITPVEEARAYGRLVELDSTVAKIAKAVGRSQKHVKGRLALLGLPGAALDLLDEGAINLSHAEDLVAAGDELADANDADWKVVADEIRSESSHGWRHNIVGTVSHRVRSRLADEKIETELAKLADSGLRRYEPKTDQWGNWSPPWELTLSRPCPVALLKLGSTEARKHRKEDCHAVLIRKKYGNDVEVAHYCTNPKRHTTKVKEPERSDIQIAPDLYATGRGRQQPASQDPLEKERDAAPKRQWTTAATALQGVKRLDDDLAGLLLIGVANHLHGYWEKVCRLLDITPDERWGRPDYVQTIRTYIETPANRHRALAALAYALTHTQTAHGWHGRGLAAVEWVMANGHEPTELEAQLIEEARRAEAEANAEEAAALAEEQALEAAADADDTEDHDPE